MKNTGAGSHARRAEAAHGFFDAPLAVEVRDARPRVRRSHGCVHVVFDAGLARQRRQTLALRLFSLDARLKRGLHPKTPHAPASARRSVGSSSRSPWTMSTPWPPAPRPLAVRLSRQARRENRRPAAPARLRRPDGPSLGDENRSIARHGLEPHQIVAQAGGGL